MGRKKKRRKRQIDPPSGEETREQLTVNDEARVPVEEEMRVVADDEGQSAITDEVRVPVVHEVPVTAEDEARLSSQNQVTLLHEGHTAEKEGRDRRQYARFAVAGRTKGRVTAAYDAYLIDISLGGALIEHAQVVRPGTISSLDLELHGKRVSLRCRVIRSVVHRPEVQPDGERELIYRTALQFLEPSDETRQVIGDYIRSIIEGK